MNTKIAFGIVGIIVSICVFCTVLSDSSDAQSDDVFSQPDLGYMNGYYFTLDSPEETANIIEKGGLSYWIKTDSQGNLVAQLVSVGEIREDGQVIIVPKTIDVDNKPCQVVSVGPYFQPFNIFDYSTNQYIRHVGLTDNLKTQDPPILPGPLGYIHLTEPQYHYSIVFQGPVKIQDYAFSEFDLFNAPILKAYCYYTMSGLTSVTFEEGVTSIGQWAFAYTSIEEITLPKSMESIGDYAFYASDIQNVIWDSDADISAHAFRGTSLLSIAITAEPKIIGEWAFNGTNLTSLSIPDSVLEIGSHAFFKCKSLTVVSIGSGVEVIPGACFNECEKLEEVIVKGTIKEIGAVAFSSGPSLSSFDFSSVEKIGYGAFEGAFQGGKDIVLDLSKVKRIENNAFNSCNANITLVLSPDLEYVGEYALVIYGDLVDPVLSIPAGCEIGRGAFLGIKISTLILGDGCIVKTKAFSKCKELESISIGDNCIFDDAVGINGSEGIFAGSALNAITIPETVVLGIATFMGCEQLEEVIFEGDRERIPQYCFSGCVNLATVQFPSGLKNIEDYAFRNCTSLDHSQIVLDCTAEDVLSWSSRAFTDSSVIEVKRLFENDLDGTISFLKLSLILDGTPTACSFMVDISGVENSMQLDEPLDYTYVMPEDLQGIYDDVMSKKLPKFEFPNGLYRVFDGAMYDETGFTLIKIPYNLSHINIAENVTHVAPNACHATYLEFVSIPSSVVEIGDYAFMSCSKLHTVEFKEGLKRIGNGAFSMTGLRSISLPSSLEYVGDYVFSNTVDNGVYITIPADSNLTHVGSLSLMVHEGSSIFIPSGLTEIGDIPFGYSMSEVYLAESPDVYPNNLLRSPTLERFINGQWVLAHAYDVVFYLPLGTNTSEIDFKQLLGCEGGSFGGYYVATQEGAVLVDEKVQTSSETVYLYSSLGTFSNADCYESSDGLIVSFSLGESWTVYDVLCEIDKGNISVLISESPYVIKLQISGEIDGSIITVSERVVSEKVVISFDSRGGTYCTPISVGTGRTMPRDIIPVPEKNRSEFIGWATENGDILESGTPITADILLHAVWEEANPRLIFDDHSHFIVKVNGVRVDNGHRVLPEDEVILEWVSREGYTFDHWSVSVGDESVEYFTEICSFTGVIDDTKLDLVENYYNLSDSLRQINTVNFPIDSGPLALQWMSSFDQDTTGSMWTGGAGTPLVVNGRLYARAGDTLYMYDLDTGRLLKTVPSVESSSFYHFIGYANGMIFDSTAKKIYDLDLNYLKESQIPITKVLSDNTGIYLASGAGGIYKYSLDLSEELWHFKEGYRSYTSWGVSGGIQIYDGYLYWVGITKDGEITLQSVDTETGLDFHELILTEFKHFMLDDGWVTCYNGTIYITVYSEGLFGDNNGATGGGVIATSIDKGVFSKEYKYYTLGSKTTSNFIVYNGRGYVNSGLSFHVYDINSDDGTTLTKAYSYNHGRFTHGGIVLNNPPGSGTVEVIFIPYDPTMSIMVFYDSPGQVMPEYRNIMVQVPSQYNSQAVRFTEDGQIYFYNDAGNVCVLGKENSNQFIILREDNKVRCITYDGIIADALIELGITDDYYLYMMNPFYASTQLEYDESLAENYRLFYFSDVPLTSAVWKNDLLWYSEEYGIMNIDGIKRGNLYLDGEEFLLIDKDEYSYTIRFVDLSGNEIKSAIAGKASAGTELNIGEFEDRNIAGYSYRGVSAERFAISPDESRNVLTFTYDVIKATVIDLTDDVVGGVATVSETDIQTLADDVNPVELILPQGKMELSNDVLKALGARGASVSVSLKTVEVKDIEEKQRENVPEGAVIFSISIESAGEYIHELGGTAKISLPISITGTNLALWYLDDAGTMHIIEDAVFSEGLVTFTTDHLSYYVVGEAPVADKEGFPVLYVVVIAIAIVALLGIVMYIRRRAHA